MTARADIRELGYALAFSDFRGNSLDAFEDHMRDVATHEHGTDRQAMGTVLVLRGYDHFARHCSWPCMDFQRGRCERGGAVGPSLD